MMLLRRSGRRCTIDDMCVQPLDILRELPVELALVAYTHADRIVHLPSVHLERVCELGESLPMLIGSAIQCGQLTLQLIDVVAMSTTYSSWTTSSCSEWALAAVITV